MASVAATRVTKKNKSSGPSGARLRFSHAVIFLFIAFFASCVLYAPALHGPFVFDDIGLPFGHGNAVGQPLSYWLAGVRPVLMLSYLVNWLLSGADTFSYHFLNLLIHIANTCLVFAIAYRIVGFAVTDSYKRIVLAVFTTAVFLVHPLQTESVAYVAGRSESLASLFALAAWAVFLYRKKEQIDWHTAILVALLFGLAVGTKENMVVVPALLLLTDIYWSRGWRPAVRDNWRLYSLIAAAAALGVIWMAPILTHSKSIGSAVTGFNPFTYLLTQTRVCWSYIRLFLVPIGQSFDHDVTPSRSVLEPLTALAVCGWVAAAACAVRFKTRFPLASFGFFTYLLLLAPTSSIIPIADAFVERRLYLPILGLLFIACEFLRRANLRSLTSLGAMAAVVLVFSVATEHRAALWEHPVQLWIDAVRSQPRKARTYLGLTNASVEADRCNDALPYFSGPDEALRSDPVFLEAWGRLLGCVGRTTEASQVFEKEAAQHPTSHVFEMIGLLDASQGKWWDAKTAFDRAVQLADHSPDGDSAFESRGYWYEVMGRNTEAIADYQQALRLNRSNYTAKAKLARLEQQVAASLNH